MVLRIESEHRASVYSGTLRNGYIQEPQRLGMLCWYIQGILRNSILAHQALVLLDTSAKTRSPNVGALIIN